MKKTTEADYLRYYMIIYYLECAALQMESLDPKTINYSIYEKTLNCYKKINQLKTELNNKSNGNFYNIFEALSNDKIFAMMTIQQRMMFMSEEQCLELEKMIQIDFQEEKQEK